MPFAYAYLRVSRLPRAENGQEQAPPGHSTQAQLGRCRAYYDSARLAARGVEWYPGKPFSDLDVSARTIPFAQRPGGRLLLDRAKAGDHVIFAFLDRGFRQLRDYANLVEVWRILGVTVHFADLGVDMSTLQGKLVADIIASVAEAEGRRISEKCKAISAHLARLGRPVNGEKRLGYRLVGPKNDRHWEADPAEREVMRWIERMRDQQGLTFREICRRLPARWPKYRPGLKPSQWMRCLRMYYAWKAIQMSEWPGLQPSASLSREALWTD